MFAKQSLALLSGLVFGAGLAFSGMTDRQVVLAFLDVFGDWNPSLAVVMASALCITVPVFQYLLKQRKRTAVKPCFSDDFDLTTAHKIDKRLVAGALIFGVGWGLYGYCPGPAIASMSYASLESAVFVVMMCVGMFLADTVNKKAAKTAT